VKRLTPRKYLHNLFYAATMSEQRESKAMSQAKASENRASETTKYRESKAGETTEDLYIFEEGQEDQDQDQTKALSTLEAKVPSVASIHLSFPEEVTLPKEYLYFQPPKCATIMYRKTKSQRPKIVITYDRKEIKRKIEKLTYPQARRLMKCIYEPVVEELYDEAEPCWAQHLQDLFEKEQQMFADEIISKSETLNHDRKLLAVLLDKVKSSDQLLADEKTKKFGYQHLYDLMVYLESYKKNFQWLTKETFYIIANMCKKDESLETGAFEIICRIYHKYGQFLDTELKDLENAIHWIAKAFKLARGELWLGGADHCKLTMHELLAPIYANLLLRQARLKISDDFEFSFGLAKEAILILCEVGIEKFNKDFCEAHLVGAAILTENHFFDNALEFLHRIECKIMDDNDELKKMTTEYYYLQGVCFMNLQQNMKAIKMLEEALKPARFYEQKRFEAMILLTMGQLINKTYNDRCGALKTFNMAAQLFKEIADVENEKRTKYLYASLKADIIFPHFMDLIKTCDTKCCSAYILRSWKNECKPFWIDMPKDFMTPVDPLYCLLEKDA